MMRRSLYALPLALLIFAPALASADPPGRVGRLSYTDGTVSFHLAGQQADWSPATVNYPVTTGESFWTEPNSRAEIQVGPAELRLDQASELDIAKLDDRSTDMQLDQGVLNLHLWQMPPGEVSVVTPRGRVVITAPGSYDIDAGQPNGDQPSDRVVVTVLEGAARFEGERGAVEIGHSEAAVISGDPMDVQLAEGNSSDFDNWALTRERREDVAQKSSYVPPAVTGYQDLDQYGSWSQDPDYGQVWYPSAVPAGWAPYRYGHWAFVPPWGWTWIDDAPWGFAPFHYGRWVDRDDRWGWVPQDIPPQPVYAPALVAFVGGDGWGVNLAAGAAVAAVGWIALAPHETYHPDYSASATYERNLNGRDWNAAASNVNARNGTVNNYRNRQGATVVPAAAFTGAAPVQRATVTVAPDELGRARTTTALTTFHPDANARAGRANTAAAAAIVPQPNAPARVAPSRVVATTPPSLAAEKPPSAPGPHRVAGAENRAPTTGAASTATPTPAPQRAVNIPNQPAPNQPSPGETRAAPSAPANANLAPHPVPPAAQQAARPPQESATAPASPPRAETRAAPNAPAHAELAPHPVPPAAQQAARPPQERPAAPPPPSPPQAAVVAQPHAPAAPAAPLVSRQSAAPPHAPPPPAAPPVMQVPHPQQQTHLAPTPQAWTRAPGPPPAAAQPRPAPAPAVHPAAAPAAVPHPAPAPAPHPAPAPAPAAAHPAAAPAKPAAPAPAPPVPAKEPDKK